ncbi:hypothetical protein ACJIZ3_008233 [Penstemon smallii]|uniref:F-box domain-containing protein n=1 Tax=Penstemon smallii TaxID=265156 RepID=A0ABD3TAV2_9LAMI
MAIGRELPNDVMIQILMRLPVKSIVRFRSVSKHWCALLKSHSFANTHLCSQWRKNVLLVRRCLPPPGNDDVLSFHDPDSPELAEVSPNLSIPFLKGIKRRYNQPYQIEGVFLLGPCDGIVCIYHDDFIMLCNPALREFKRLPLCPFACPQGCYFDIQGHGFGNICTNDFKVVLLQDVDPDENYYDVHIMVNLYSSSTNSWKQIDGGESDATQLGYVSTLPYTQVFFNGACHWPACHQKPNYEVAILTFDLSTEALGWIEYPDISTERTNWLSLMVVNECLAVGWYCLGSEDPIDIWVMKEYGVRESWTKQFVIGPFIDNIYPVLPWKNEWVLMDENENKIDQLVTCSLSRNEIKRYQVYGQERTFSALIYQESLISLAQD